MVRLNGCRGRMAVMSLALNVIISRFFSSIHNKPYVQ